MTPHFTYCQTLGYVKDTIAKDSTNKITNNPKAMVSAKSEVNAEVNRAGPGQR